MEMISENKIKRMTKAEIIALIEAHRPRYALFFGTFFLKKETKQDLINQCWIFGLTDYNPYEGWEFIPA